MHQDKRPQCTAGEWERLPGQAFVLEVIAYFTWLWLSGMRPLKKGFLILHHFQSGGVDQAFVWAVLGTFISTEDGELKSHKFFHSAPCVGFFFLVVLMGTSSCLTSPSDRLCQQGPGENPGDPGARPQRQQELFLMGRRCILPALLDFALLPCSGHVIQREHLLGSPLSSAALVVKYPSANGGDIRDVGSIPGLEKGMATHSSILAWRIPWTEEPGENYSPRTTLPADLWSHEGHSGSF